MNKLPEPAPGIAVDQSRDLSRYATQFHDSGDILPLIESQERIGRAQQKFWASKSAGLLLVFQGLDTSGKDGCIKRLAQAMHPMGFTVKGFVEPSAEEAAHEFLWRVWPHFPALGKVAIFNRSYYEALMIERVLDLVPSITALDERVRAIREVERHLYANNVVVLKFWLHISASEQKQRLLSRLDEREKHWKFKPSDVRLWKLRTRYLEAASQAIHATHSVRAPWHIVAADDKALCRRAITQRVAKVMEALAGEYPLMDENDMALYRAELERANADD